MSCSTGDLRSSRRPDGDACKIGAGQAIVLSGTAWADSRRPWTSLVLLELVDLEWAMNVDLYYARCKTVGEVASKERSLWMWASKYH